MMMLRKSMETTTPAVKRRPPQKKLLPKLMLVADATVEASSTGAEEKTAPHSKTMHILALCTNEKKVFAPSFRMFERGKLHRRLISIQGFVLLILSCSYQIKNVRHPSFQQKVESNLLC
jgi:hypothetical protein